MHVSPSSMVLMRMSAPLTSRMLATSRLPCQQAECSGVWPSRPRMFTSISCCKSVATNNGLRPHVAAACSVVSEKQFSCRRMSATFKWLSPRTNLKNKKIKICHIAMGHAERELIGHTQAPPPVITSQTRREGGVVHTHTHTHIRASH